jgi:hypothetical protein
MLAAVAEAYRRTKKPKDIPWNRWVARPLAAVLLVPLMRSRVTPNQITLASLAVFAVAMALLITQPGQRGLIIAIVVLEFSYVLDCVDGQLARFRGTSTPVGAHLDFLMDELKAFLLVAATSARIWTERDRVEWLFEGLTGLVVVASAISLTTFVRRPEYVRAGGAASKGSGDYGDGFSEPEPDVAPVRRSLIGRILGAVEAIGRFCIHYPSYLPFIALANRLDLFLHVYVAMNAAYAARTLLGVTRTLGRSAR